MKMKKTIESGIKSPKIKAPDKKGAYIDVQKRTLGNMKKGGKVKPCLGCGGKTKK